MYTQNIIAFTLRFEDKHHFDLPYPISAMTKKPGVLHMCYTLEKEHLFVGLIDQETVLVVPTKEYYEASEKYSSEIITTIEEVDDDEDDDGYAVISQENPLDYVSFWLKGTE